MVWNPDIELIEGFRHRCFLSEAYIHAWEGSEDPITKTGAIIVEGTLDKLSRKISYGANHFPNGLNPTDEQINDRDWKYKHIIHAETSAIFSAAKEGKSLEGTIMYMPWIPCTPCAIAIVDSGIKTLIGHKEMIMKTPERWHESTDYALDLLEKGGVKRFMWEGKIYEDNLVKSLFDGKVWYP